MTNVDLGSNSFNRAGTFQLFATLSPEYLKNIHDMRSTLFIDAERNSQSFITPRHYGAPGLLDL